MRFIVVGPDGAGKTTFCKWLAERHNLDYVGCTYRENNKYARTLELLERDNIIYDRLYLPDHIVYSILKDEPMEVEEFAAWVGLMTDIKQLGNVIVIYVDAPDEVIEERLETRGDEYIEFEEIREIRRIYKEIIPHLELPIIRVESIDNEFNIVGFGMED